MQNYDETIRRIVCAHCIDALPDGRCSLMHYADCPVPKFLPQMIGISQALRSEFAEDYRKIIYKQICPTCPNFSAGDCALRAEAECPLDRYLILVLEAIDAAEESVTV